MEKKQPRFLRLEDVADELNVSIERSELESYIQRQYAYTREAAERDALAEEFAD